MKGGGKRAGKKNKWYLQRICSNSCFKLKTLAFHTPYINLSKDTQKRSDIFGRLGQREGQEREEETYPSGKSIRREIVTLLLAVLP